MLEQWKDVPGFEGRYQVSDLGRVKSLDRRVRFVSKAGNEATRLARGCVLKPGLCREYLIVNLAPKGTIAVHLLVARAFVPNPKGLPEANHIDGVKANCKASNLEWTTHLGNLEHAVSLGLFTQAIRVVHPKTGEVFPSIARAARTVGVDEKTVRQTWARA